MSFFKTPLFALALGGLALSAFSAGLDIKFPNAKAVLNAGVSYDILRDPTNVSFEYPEGYMSMNLPLPITTNSVDFSAMAPGMFGKDTGFFPTFGAIQRPNFSFRINVPMLKGVCTYAQTRNVEFEYNMLIGNAQFFVDTTIPDNASVMMRGFVNAPIQYKMGWSTQTFGYAFKPMKDMVVGINLHRHLFEMELNGLVSVDVLGKVKILSPAAQGIELPAINYDSDHTYGVMTGRFSTAAWSPAVGIKWWRLGLSARVGVSGAAPGFFNMKYSVPFFIDKNTFTPDLESFNFDTDTSSAGNQPADSTARPVDPVQLMSDISNSAVDSVKSISDSSLHFNIPSGISLSFDILKSGRLAFTYSYVRGEISGLHNRTTPAFGRSEGTVIDDLNFGIDINHVMVLGYKSQFFRANVGAFFLDFRWRQDANLLQEALGLGLPGAPVPIFNLAAMFGTTTRGLLELDLLPIPSLKTGVIYYF
jgi:hypothetical protein